MHAMSETLKQVLTRMGQKEHSDGHTALEHIAVVVMRNALAGDLKFIRYLSDSTEGRPSIAPPDNDLTEGRSKLIAMTYLRLYGPITDEERQSVAGEVGEMERLKAWNDGD